MHCMHRAVLYWLDLADPDDVVLMIEQLPQSDPITAAIPPNGYPPADTYALRMRGGAISGETVSMLPHYSYDLAALHSRIASASTPEALPDLVDEEIRRDPDQPFRSTLLESIRRIAAQQVLVLVHVPAEVVALQLLREVAALCLSHTELLGIARPRVLRFDPLHDPRLEYNVDRQLDRQLGELKDLVVLVPRSDRRTLGHDLVELAERLSGRGILVIAATDLPLSGWKLRAEERSMWLDLRSEVCYNPNALVALLRSGLLERYDQLHPAFKAAVAPEANYDQIQLSQIAATLGSPTRIRALLRLLDRPGAIAEDPRRLIGFAAKHPLGELVAFWYRQFDRRHQLLALALVLLIELPEGQLFGALEELIEGVWGLRAPGTPMLDVIDLEPLRDFIRLVEHGMAESRLEPDLDRLRPLLAATAATTYRRHLQYAQLWLARLMIRSLSDDAQSFQILLGSAEQRARVRSAAMEALSDLACMSPTLARPALLLLIAQHRDELHHAVARALSRWYATGAGSQLNRVLREWAEDPKARTIVNAVASSDGSDITDDGAELLVAAAMLTLGYAAADMPSGTLEPELIDQFTALVRQSVGRRALRYLEYEIMPMLLPLHLQQLRPLLSEMILNTELRDGILRDLKRLYSEHNQRALIVRETIRGWLSEGFREMPDGRVPLRGPAEERLMTVAEFLSMLDYRLPGRPISLDEAWGYLHAILARIDGTAARGAVLAASMALASYDPSKITRVLADIRIDEENSVVEALARQNDQQRRAMHRSIAQMDVGHGITTELEELLIDWITSVRRTTGRYSTETTERLVRISFLVFVAAARAQVSRQIEPDDNRARKRVQQRPFYRQKLMPILLFSDLDDRVAESLDQLLPHALTLAQNEPAAFSTLIEIWEQIPDLAPLAERLERAEHLERSERWGFGIVDSTTWFQSLWMALTTRS